MTKTKKPRIYLPLVISGYTLFAALVIATLLSTTIPFTAMLFDPRVLHFNVAVTAIALTVGAILPVLIGYIIGDHSVKSKSKLTHHFNGILFGLLAYWLMTIVGAFLTIPDGWILNHTVRMILVNLIPAIAVAIIVTLLAVAHVRGRQATQNVLEYKPFSSVLIGAIVVLPLWSLLYSSITNSITFYSFVPLAMVCVLGLISYLSLRNTRLNRYGKVAWAAVSISVAFVMVYVSSQLAYSIATYVDLRPTMESQAMVSVIGFMLALVGWILFWSRQVRVTRP